MTNVVEHGTRRSLVVAAVMLAALLQLADTTIVNVSLPTIDGSLGASVDEGTWFVTSYIIANVIVIPLSPFFSTVIGRGRYFAISIAGFTVMSLVCGLATDTSQEIAFRFLQGAFGGGLMVPAQQIMRDTFPPEELGKSQALFGLAVVMGPTIGPTLGGLLTDQLSWNWCFFINVVPGAIAAVLAFLFIRDPEKPKRAHVDGIGVGLLAIGLGSLQYVLEEGERNDWFADATITLVSVIAVIGLALFIWWELRTKQPAVALRVLALRPVAIAVTISFVGGAVLYGLFILQPQYTQASLGFTSTESGILMMLRAVTTLALFPATNWVVNRQKIDQRFVVGAGLAVYSLSSIWIAQLTTTTADFDAFIPAQMLGGAGLAFFFVPLNVVLLRSIAPAVTPPALALLRLLQQLGGSVASAMLVTYVDRSFVVHDAALRGGVTLAGMAKIYLTRGGTEFGLAHAVAAQDTVLAIADALWAVGIFGLATAPLVFLFERKAKAVRAEAPPAVPNARLVEPKPAKLEPAGARP